jgi:putative hydrolase of the HAD superfamily
MAIRTLLFDLGNVLFYFSHDRMCAQIAHVCGISDARLREILFAQGLQRQFERGELSEGAFHETIQKAVGRPVDFVALRRAGSDIFLPNERLFPLLDRWKCDGYRLVLLSNTCVTHYDWVRSHFDALDCFDDCVLSYVVGAVKPEDAIFQSALDTIGCDPGECFYTDDISDYVERGRSLGLQAEIFVDVPTLVRQLERRGVACADSKG